MAAAAAAEIPDSSLEAAALRARPPIRSSTSGRAASTWPGATSGSSPRTRSSPPTGWRSATSRPRRRHRQRRLPRRRRRAGRRVRRVQHRHRTRHPLRRGRFRSGENQFRMEGEEIVKHGDDTYSFEKGMFTTCRCPPGERDPWQIRAGSADLEVGGYGTARNSTFEILGVPVVWLPWMIYPLKTERQSGLLFPEFGYGGRNGVDVGLPIFWAARDPQRHADAAVAQQAGREGRPRGRVRVRREVGGRDLRIVPLRRGHRTELPEDPFDRERWASHGEQDVFLPYAWRLKSDFQFISDNEYLVDFDDLPARRNDRFLESNAFVAGRSARTAASARGGAAVTADDLQNPDDQDRDEFLLQRLPTVAAARAAAPSRCRCCPGSSRPSTPSTPTSCRGAGRDKLRRLRRGYVPRRPSSTPASTAFPSPARAGPARPRSLGRRPDRRRLASIRERPAARRRRDLRGGRAAGRRRPPPDLLPAPGPAVPDRRLRRGLSRGGVARDPLRHPLPGAREERHLLTAGSTCAPA